MAKSKKNIFPKDFLWGASVSSHQVEGGNHNQWSVWELAHAAERAKTAEKRLSWLPNWAEIKDKASDPDNYVSGSGVEHYKRYEEDFDLIKKLNLNSFRFGIEWSRIEPDEGVWDEEAIKHYHNYIAELKKRGIEPVMNIWHWTNPVWFEAKGGFKHKSNLKYWDRFIAKIAEEYGKDLKWAITINEPNNYALFGYLVADTSSGERWPPGEKNYFSARRVYWNLVRAHRRAYPILKKSNPSMQIGVAMNLANIQAKHPGSILDRAVTWLMRYSWNWWYLSRTRKQQDFIGANYYFTDYYEWWLKRRNPPLPINDTGWYMEPGGLYPLLLRAHKLYGKPIMVTENGVADARDQYRRWWIEETILSMERALSEGIKVSGYFHWSLLDNFEWGMGWWPKFGLVAVDREHGMKRTVRLSAQWFADYLKKLR